MDSTPAALRRICHLDELADGTALGFEADARGKDRFFIVRQGQQVYGWRNACPHKGYQGAPMAWRKNAYVDKSGQWVVCSGHGARFDPVTGIGQPGPCQGQALEAITITVTADGQVYYKPDQTKEK